MMFDVEKERNHYFDWLKYLLFILVVLIHNPLGFPHNSTLKIYAKFILLTIYNTVQLLSHFHTHVHQDNAEWNYTIEDPL